jgi:hypothetical protein
VFSKNLSWLYDVFNTPDFLLKLNKKLISFIKIDESLSKFKNNKDGKYKKKDSLVP